jgi:hypothetical protein
MKAIKLAFLGFLAAAPALADSLPIGAANGATGQVSVGTAATLIAAARSGGVGVSRASITVTNTTGSDKLCIGFTNAVTATTGECLPPIAGVSITLATTAAIYGVVPITAQTVSFVELY